MTLVSYAHITIAEDGRAWIADKPVRVTQVVLDYLAYGWSPVEIHQQHPYLAPAEIHAAFVYYYDHQEELDRQIADELAAVDRLKAQTYNHSLQERFRKARETS